MRGAAAGFVLQRRGALALRCVVLRLPMLVTMRRALGAADGVLCLCGHNGGDLVQAGEEQLHEIDLVDLGVRV